MTASYSVLGNRVTRVEPETHIHFLRRFRRRLSSISRVHTPLCMLGSAPIGSSHLLYKYIYYIHFFFFKHFPLLPSDRNYRHRVFVFFCPSENEIFPRFFTIRIPCNSENAIVHTLLHTLHYLNTTLRGRYVRKNVIRRVHV